ncbi:MAG: threonine--tRNA ligase, partial [Candidatus Babeliales bacterium]
APFSTYKEPMSNEKDLSILRHSAAHLLGHAVSELFPNTQLTIGPATKNGFFYDFLPPRNFKLEDLPLIQARMHEIADQNLPLIHKEISKKEARTLYKDNPFKLELIDQIPGDTVGLATQGNFYDLCRGGHVASTGDIKNFILEGISGSYWRADRDNQPLQRISGTAFFTAKDLDAYIQHKEDAQKYDHRRLGKELDLFSFHDEGLGFPFFHEKGKKIINSMVEYVRKLQDEAGYQEVATPQMLSDRLWRTSGHYDHYKNNMFFSEIEKESYAIKPMNCPGMILIYKSRPHSYRELPLRMAEFGLVHRYELSGVLHGLFRVRAFTVDDAHIFCTPDQIEGEVKQVVQLTFKVLKKFGFDTIDVAVSTKPEKAMGSDELWEQATYALTNTLNQEGITYKIQKGEGAFYGPKIEFKIKDSMGREWQCGTIQVDFFLPENFDLTYTTSEGTKARPVIIHRAIYGSLERFFAILLEHYKGHLPFWITPTQIRVLPISDDQMNYAQDIYKALKNAGLRVELETSADPLSGKIKTAQRAKIPWMLIVGAKEVAQNTITLRHHDGKQEFGLSLDTIIKKSQALL